MKNSFKYMIKNWIAWDKKSVLYSLVRIPILVILPIITALIPKVMIDCINNGIKINKVVLTIALLSLLITITTWLDPFLRELIDGGKKIVRMRYAMLAFQKILYAPYSEIENLKNREDYKKTENFYKNVNSDGPLFINILSDACVSIVGVITTLFIIFKINYYVIILILLSCVAEFLILRLLNKKEFKLWDDSYIINTKFDYFYKLSKNSTNAKEIRLYNFSDRFISIIANFVREFEKITSRFSNVNKSISAVRALLNFFREIISYVYLTILLISNKINSADFVFYLGIITGFSNWIISIVFSISKLEKCCFECENYRKYVENNNSNTNTNNIDIQEEIDTIEFKNVTFSYPNSNKNIVDNLSFIINKGEKIALVGENGAGKTTIVKLLCGLYEPTSGEILINGKKEKNPNMFSVVFQDYKFLPLTIAENICASKNYNKERLIQCLKKVEIYDKIQTLEKQENSYMIKEVHKDAVSFSGGEIQKLLLAKAIYKNAPILVLDEPTAALDPIAEYNLYLKYNEITKNKLSVFISHRLSSTKFCDKILLLSNGKINELGTHSELMNLKGKYYKMYQVQSYYYKEHCLNNE